MADTTATPDEPGTVTKTVTEPTPASEPAEPQGPDDGGQATDSTPARKEHEARRSARERARKLDEGRAARSGEAPERDAAAEARDAHQERRRDPETGQFAKEGAAQDSPEDEREIEQEQGTDPADTGGEQEQDDDAAAAEERPSDEGAGAEGAGEDRPEYVRIELPEGHPLREQGRGEIAVSPEDAERVKALANGSYTRRQELEDRDRRLEDRDRRLEELEKENVQLKSRRTAAEKYKQTPEYRDDVQRYKRLAELEKDGEVPEGTAQQFWAGANQRFEEFEKKEFNEQWGEVEGERAQQQAQQFVNDAYGRAEQFVPDEVRHLPAYGQKFQAALRMFDHGLSEGHFPGVQSVEQQHEAFGRFFRAQLIQDPEFKKAFSRATARIRDQNGQRTPAPGKDDGAPAAPKREDVEREVKRDMANRRRERPPNPMAGLGHGPGSDRAAPAGEDDDAPNPRSLPPHVVQRQARKSARERGRARTR